jgi:2-polyprenyl-3-methyl-5-hydroxy-6-metoxy-1,4-benzoquinol methylase
MTDAQHGTGGVGVLVVAYNAASTLARVLDRLPQSFRERVRHVLVCDDASQDDTYLVGLGYRTVSDLPLTVIRHPVNLGYGGNQKAGYRWAIEHGLEVVVLLHGDGQYAPEVIEDLVAPIEHGDADAVFGSRMMTKGAARAGGMPLYKYVGNRILTTYENAMAGLELTEWHSGYRAYRVSALRDIDFESNSDGFDFDTEIILQLHEAGKRITEVAIPTYYGDEICHVNGLKYAKDVVRDVTRHRLRKVGFGPGQADGGARDDGYELKLTPHSSHGRLLAWIVPRPAGRVLDVGCSNGRFGALLRLEGHEVVGVDVAEHDGVHERLDAFVQADLNQGLPQGLDGPFDVIVAADVLEHVVDPARLLGGLHDLLAPGGRLYTSIPNFGHWYPRARVAAGRFDYDRRGILDAGHVRFFTRRTAERLIADAGFDVCRRDVVGVPVEVAERGGRAPRRPLAALAAADRVAAALWPTMFGYQFVYELRRS